MTKQGCLIASALLSATVVAQAGNPIEDPFAYDEREKERENGDSDKEDSDKEDSDKEDSDKEDSDKEDSASDTTSERTFGSSGDFVLSVERLAGYARTTHIIQQVGRDTKTNVDRIHGLISPGGDVVGFSAPRIAFDVFATNGLSLGGSIGYGQDSSSDNRRLIVLSPRIGYALMFGEVVGIWPRAGVTYQMMYTDAADAWLLAGTVDLPFVLVAGSHVAFTLGPRMDLSFAGKYFPEKGTRTLWAREFGFSTGLSVFF